MDRSLDDVISERQRGRAYRDQGRRQNGAPRDGVRKSHRDEPKNLDRDWVHDRFDNEHEHDGRRPQRNARPSWPRREPETEHVQTGAKIRVENLHYDLSEEDLRELFTRIGPLQDLALLYDRQDRSRGLAFVTYTNVRDAEDAIDEFDGANAKGQPIRLTLVPAAKPRNPFDHVERPSRSLFDRIDGPRRSASPDDQANVRQRSDRNGTRRGDWSRPALDNGDRYIPGPNSRRSSPRRPTRATRGPGQRKEQQRGPRRDRDRASDGQVMVGGRPKKTQEELDEEMNDYWGKSATEPNGGAPASPTFDPVANTTYDDMIQ